jgi:hypothetical protein
VFVTITFVQKAITVKVREYPISVGCEVDVMHAQERSILRQNIRREIVYYYPFDDYKAIKIFNVVIMVSVGNSAKVVLFRDSTGKTNPAKVPVVFA